MSSTTSEQPEIREEAGAPAPAPITKKDFKWIDPREILDMSMKFCSYNPLFYHAWMLGTPVLTDRDDVVPTAAVQFDREGSALYYIFNTKFWNKLNRLERMFVFAHEILHVFLNHGRREVSGNKTIANIAMDLVINHLLLDKFGFDRSKLTHLSTQLCFVDTVFKPEEKVEIGKSFEYYYNILKKTAREIKLIILSGSSGANGLTAGEVTKILEEQLGQQLPNSVKEQIKNTMAGTSAGTLEFPLDPYEVVTKRKTWEALIKNVLSRAMAETYIDRWMPKNRRTQHLSSNIFLPSTVEDETTDKVLPNLWVFADTSGSCYEEAKRFFRALKSIPTDKFNIRGFGFDTSIYEVNFRNPKFKGFGGTSFSIISNYINQATKHPDLVFVFTDGAGDPVAPTMPTRWHWFLTPNGYRNYFPATCHAHELEAFYK